MAAATLLDLPSEYSSHKLSYIPLNLLVKTAKSLKHVAEVVQECEERSSDSNSDSDLERTVALCTTEDGMIGLKYSFVDKYFCRGKQLKDVVPYIYSAVVGDYRMDHRQLTSLIGSRGRRSNMSIAYDPSFAGAKTSVQKIKSLQTVPVICGMRLPDFPRLSQVQGEIAPKTRQKMQVIGESLVALFSTWDEHGPKYELSWNGMLSMARDYHFVELCAASNKA
jgi:hypothetical protein